MGSTSGALAGDKDTALDALLKDTMPVPVPAAGMANTTESNERKG